MSFELLTQARQWKLTGKYLVLKQACCSAVDDVAACKKLAQSGFVE
jgi:hypothetical protein